VSVHATLRDAIVYFADYEHCHEVMVKLRWPDGNVKCPVCVAENVTYLARSRVWKCYANHMKPHFSLKTVTIFEDSPIGLDRWLTALWMLLNAKDGVSSGELHRTLGVTQKTAWFMIYRIRVAMQDRTFNQLGGEARQKGTAPGQTHSPPMTAEQFEKSPEFRRFRTGMKRILTVSKANLDRRVQEAKLNSDRIYNPNAPGRKRKAQGE
jgi:hypothetical protein